MNDPEMVIVKCECCKQEFPARVADRKRGWGRFCSKRCKAIKQTYGKRSFVPGSGKRGKS